MHFVLSPAVALCNRLGYLPKFSLIGALVVLAFGLPLLSSFTLGGDAAVPLTAAGAASGLLALYFLAALCHSQRATTNQFAGAIARFAKGDLSARIPVVTQDEMGGIAAAFNSMGKEVKRMIVQVSSHAEDVADAAEKLAHRSEEVRSGTQQQSDAATSVAAAMQEMTTSIAQVSGHANETETVSRRASQLSEDGERVVREASDEMSRIAESFRESANQVGALGARTDEVSRIVQVIRDIAEQTNLLALNAAIEAARAGEQGRGFAVVADEVRKLAERTGHATTEIGEMIDSIQAGTQGAVSSMESGVGRVSHGVELADRAAQALSDINEGARNALMMVHDIVNAVQEQSTVSGEISQSVERISSMAQTGNENTRRMSGEATRLDEVSANLKQAISKFSGGTTREAAELVERAATFYASHGREKAFAAFNDPHGQFVQRDLYLFVYDMNGSVLAHGGNPKLIGQNMLDAKDASGKAFIRERIDIATREGHGWQDYMFRNPETGENESKTSCIRRVGDVIMGCGVYK